MPSQRGSFGELLEWLAARYGISPSIQKHDASTVRHHYEWPNDVPRSGVSDLVDYEWRAGWRRTLEFEEEENGDSDGYGDEEYEEYWGDDSGGVMRIVLPEEDDSDGDVGEGMSFEG